MDNMHIIQKQVFAFEIENEEVFQKLCNTLEKLIKGELGAHIEKILDKYVLPGHNIIIDKLEIDLGNIDYGNLYNSVRSKFLNGFEKIIEETLKQTSNQRIKLVDNKTSKTTLFSYFIQYGNFPWWMSTDEKKLKIFLTKFLLSKSNHALSIWNRIKTDPIQMKRLVYYIDLELLISFWSSCKYNKSKGSKEEWKEYIKHVIEIEYHKHGEHQLTYQLKFNLLQLLLNPSKNWHSQVQYNDPLTLLFNDLNINRNKLPAFIRSNKQRVKKEVVNIPNKKDIRKNTSKITYPGITISQEAEQESALSSFQYFLENGYYRSKDLANNLSDINKIFKNLLEMHLSDTAEMIRRYGKNNRIRQRFLDNISQENINLFFISVAPEKKELFNWISEVYISTEENLKPINQTNIRVQKSINEITLEIFIQRDLNNINNEAFLKLHFNKMALRYHIKYDDLIRLVVTSINKRHKKITNPNKFILILNKLYEQKSTLVEQEDDYEEWEIPAQQEKREIPAHLMHTLTREVLKELMYLKNTGILGKNNFILQNFITDYIRITDKTKNIILDNIPLLIKSIADYLEIDKTFFEFGLKFSVKNQKYNSLHGAIEHPLFEYVNKSNVGSVNIDTTDELSILIKHLIKYRAFYDSSHLRLFLNKKSLFQKVDKNLFRQFMELLYGDNHRKISGFINSMIQSNSLNIQKKIEKQVYAVFILETIHASASKFNIKNVLGKIKSIITQQSGVDIEIPGTISEISSAFASFPKKKKRKESLSKSAYMREKSILTLYHILELDLVLEGVGANFFQNILFSFDLLLTKHKDEFLEVLHENRFNKELSHFLSYEDQSGILQRIQKIYPSQKIDRILQSINFANQFFEKLNWLKLNKEESVKYLSVFLYPFLFSKSELDLTIHNVVYNIIETAEKDNLLSQDFFKLFKESNDKDISTYLSRILSLNKIPESDSKENSGTDITSEFFPLRLNELSTLAKKNKENPNSAYYTELLSTVLQTSRFPEGHVFFPDTWTSHKEYIQRILKKESQVLKSLLKKQLPLSSQIIILEWLDIELIYEAFAFKFNMPVEEITLIIKNWINSIKAIREIKEDDILKNIILQSKEQFTFKGQKNIHLAISSFLLKERILSVWDIMEIILNPNPTIKSITENIHLEDLTKFIQLDANTWTDFYFKILSSPLLGNKKAYKELNPWIRFLFSSPVHKTQRQVFVFLFNVYFKYSFWKIKDPFQFHNLLLKELDILKNKDYSEVLVLVNYMVRAGIPIKTISDVNKQSRTSDGHNILEIIKLIERSGNNSSQSVFSLKNLKLTSLGILTAEEFSEEFLYENIKNKKSPLFFQNWINEKNWDNLKWTDFYFKILSSPLLGNKLAEKELNPWIRFLFSSPIYKSQKDVFVFIIKMYFKYEFWKVKETTLFHSQLLKELDIFKNKDYSEVVLLINYMVSSGIPMQIIADLNKNTITSDGQPIIDIIKSIQSAGNSTAQIEFLLKDRKLTSSGILTPEQFSETLLFKKIKNNKATLFFQKWIGEKDWSSEELKKLFQILNSSIIIRELKLMARSNDLEEIINTWVSLLEKIDTYSNKAISLESILIIILKKKLWKYLSKEFINTSIFNSLKIFDNKKRNDIILIFNTIKESELQINISENIENWGTSIEGIPISSILNDLIKDEKHIQEISKLETGSTNKEQKIIVNTELIKKEIILFFESGEFSTLFLENKIPELKTLVTKEIKKAGIAQFVGFDSLHPNSLLKILDFFNRDEIKNYLLNEVKDSMQGTSVDPLLFDIINKFFQSADLNDIVSLIKVFNVFVKDKYLTIPSKMERFFLEISKIKEMDKTITKVLSSLQIDEIRNSKLKFLKSSVKEAKKNEHVIENDIEKIFIYFLEYGMIMPYSYVNNLQELRKEILNHMKKNPGSVRYILHIKSESQKSRKRIVQMMRTGMSSIILTLIHSALDKTLNNFESMMKNHFNINVWYTIGINNDSDKWDYLLSFWAGLSSNIKDPIEMVEVLLKSVIKKLDIEDVRKLKLYSIKEFSSSEKRLWKELRVMIPDLKDIPKDQGRKLKPIDSLNPNNQREPIPEEIMNPEEGITIFNAGLVLLWPFLNRYFSMLGLLEGKLFIGNKEKERAIQLTQFLVTGKTEMDEWDLSLNKIICGTQLNFPVSPTIEITPEEEDLSIKMLKGALQNWEKLKKTSPGTFRETFLQREGRLYKRDNRWELIVEKKAYDVLLDSLPWNISMIKLNWMSDRMVVEWN